MVHAKIDYSRLPYVIFRTSVLYTRANPSRRLTKRLGTVASDNILFSVFLIKAAVLLVFSEPSQLAENQSSDHEHQGCYKTSL